MKENTQNAAIYYSLGWIWSEMEAGVPPAINNNKNRRGVNKNPLKVYDENAPINQRQKWSS
jgi:hypothetical protein